MIGLWDDASLESALAGALENEPGMGGSYVQVEVKNGRVRIHGYVHSVSQRERALSVARNFGGLDEVVSDLQITP